jgi:hypothetical protein
LASSWLSNEDLESLPTGAYQATPEQLTPKKEGEPPSPASKSIADVWISALESQIEKMKAELRREEAIFDEVRAHK